MPVQDVQARNLSQVGHRGSTQSVDTSSARGAFLNQDQVDPQERIEMQSLSEHEEAHRDSSDNNEELMLHEDERDNLLMSDDDKDIGDQDQNQAQDETPQYLRTEQQNKQDWLFNAVISGIYILMWYGFSVTLSVYNKWMFSPDKLNFPFPVTTTSGHQIVQAILAYIVVKIHERKESSTSTTPSYSWKEYISRFLPCAAASAGDIGMGNASMRLVTLTFYTMVKSSNLGFVLLFGFLFKLEKVTVRLTGIILVMTVGVVMMVAGETEFQLFGFLLVLGAAACSGLRWSLTQILMKRPGDGGASTGGATHNNPLRTILYLSPLMGALLFVIGMVLEGPIKIVQAELWQTKGVFLGGLILIVPGLIAFCMTLAEFLLLNRTSVLTLSIAGIFKELVTIVVAAVAFGDRLTATNSLGLVVTLGAIVAYNWYRYTTIQ